MVKICTVRPIRMNKIIEGITNQKFRDEAGGNMDHKYRSYDIYENANTFGELFEFELTKGKNRSNVKNACFLNAIIHTFKSSFDKQNEKKRIKFIMSIESLSEFLNDRRNDFGVSIEYAVEKFF